MALSRSRLSTCYSLCSVPSRLLVRTLLFILQAWYQPAPSEVPPVPLVTFHSPHHPRLRLPPAPRRLSAVSPSAVAAVARGWLLKGRPHLPLFCVSPALSPHGPERPSWC